ncbi:fungal-specific transcription factor domain-containing protein [Diplogelasinospora grovesii]|uniref:Fungal-specific transcription factor domain-containing protein n=1 Tax=Diplogelasinospora grovesii TaxID=303347 RepID=A0AAN6S6S4_9PEZI|nr:fungal-specific transcription factor domain-containing protein [Diplogelasinospora grovesii]
MEHSSPKHETKRKHVTTACVACRESKVKCNGATPTCSSCLSKDRECRYEAREDKRKLSLRIAIELLSNRVQQLSQFIEDHGLQLPSMAPDDDKTLSGILQTLQLPRVQPKPRQERAESETGAMQGSPAAPRLDRGTEPPRSAGAPAPNMSGMPASEDAGASPVPAMRGLLELANAAGNMGGIIPNPAGWNWNMPPESIPQGPMVHPGYVPTGAALPGFSGNMPTSPQQQSVSGGVPSCPSMEMDDSMSSTESVDELVDQLSDRVGTLHVRPGGHIRFYGSTSNFNLLETPAADVSMNVHRTIRDDGPEHLDRLGLNKDVPAEVEDHLMELYFTWQDPSFHVVDRKMYEEAKVLWCDKMEDTSYYSEALRNAICALGAAFDARHHPAFVTFPRSLADFFADRAKALLEIELDSPCVATIQTLVLLSAHDIGCGRDARGWLFSGMAMRLSFNLALHHDLRPYIAKGVVTTAEADLRRTVFWAAFVVDHVWSFYLGQPFRMSMKGVSLDKPGAKSRSEMPGQYTPNPAMAQSFSPMTERIDDVCRYQVLLFEAMAPLRDTLYGSETTSKSALQELNQQTVTKLVDWKESLPVELRVDLGNREATYLPHVILLHMQYYQSIIYAHRPWMSKSHIQPQPPQGPGAGHARKMCMDAASAIAQLLRLYEERYTLRRINIQAVAITFSAALLLVFATVSHYQPERDDEIVADLSACFRALDELAPSWDTAKRARDFLIRLQRHWERQARSNSLASARDATGSTRSGFSSSRKRPRVSIGPSDESPPVRFRVETASSLQGEYWADGSNSTAVDFGMDLDFDWMLATSMEGMPGNWGNVFSVQSSNVMPN